MIRPPAFPTRLLQWCCKDDLIEMIEGDLHESFQNRIKTHGLKNARWFYFVSVLQFIRPFAVRKARIPSTVLGMNTHYLKVSIRSLLRDRSNAVISMFSLAVAFFCGLMIYSIVDYELSYDSQHTHADRIYRITYEEIFNPERNRKMATVGPPLGPAIEEYFPEVEAAVRFRYTDRQIVTQGDHEFYEERIFFADPSLFEVFSFTLQAGDPKTALDQKDAIILTEPMATKYFGDTNPMGKMLDVDGELLLVTGVFAHIPKNVHLSFDFIRPFDAFEVPFGYPVTLDDWGWISFHTYILVNPDADREVLETKLPEFALTHFEEERAEKFRYRLQPLRDIYFGAFGSDVVASGNIRYVWMLGTIGIMLLVLSMFNFTNIATAKAISRGVETGVRKSLGSSTWGLRWRYVQEPIVLSIIAALLAMWLLKPGFAYAAAFLGLENLYSTELVLQLGPLLMMLAVFVGVVAGIYPSFIMASFKPLVALKNRGSSSGNMLRKSLLAFQFAITSMLLIGSFLIQNQIGYMLEKDLGYEKDKIALLHAPGDVLERYFEPIRNVLLQNPRITNVSIAGNRMEGDSGSGPIQIDGNENPFAMTIDAVGEDFFQTIGVEVLEGREFSSTISYDSADGVILNVSAAEALGWTPSQAIGQHILVGGRRDGHVMGVVENFHFRSLHDHVQPLVIIYPHTRLTEVYVRFEAGSSYELIQEIEAGWNKVLPDIPFDFAFLNDHIQQLYQTDIQFASLVRTFSWITITIAILGLYGLVNLISSFRLKEVGVRKVLGASSRSVIATLSRSFVALVLFSTILSWPVAYLLTKEWLQTFAYQAPISIRFFVLGSLITLGIATITIVWRALGVARYNPSRILRHE